MGVCKFVTFSVLCFYKSFNTVLWLAIMCQSVTYCVCVDGIHADSQYHVEKDIKLRLL